MKPLYTLADLNADEREAYEYALKAAVNRVAYSKAHNLPQIYKERLGAHTKKATKDITRFVDEEAYRAEFGEEPPMLPGVIVMQKWEYLFALEMLSIYEAEITALTNDAENKKTKCEKTHNFADCILIKDRAAEILADLHALITATTDPAEAVRVIYGASKAGVIDFTKFTYNRAKIEFEAIGSKSGFNREKRNCKEGVTPPSYYDSHTTLFMKYLQR